VRLLSLIVAFSALAACTERPLTPRPSLPPAISAWTDDRPYGEKGIQTEQRVTRATEAQLQGVAPGIKTIGGDVVTLANQAAARAWLEGYFRGLEWEATGVADTPNTIGWKSDDRFFAAQFTRLYPEADLVLVSYYAKGFAPR